MDDTKDGYDGLPVPPRSDAESRMEAVDPPQAVTGVVPTLEAGGRNAAKIAQGDPEAIMESGIGLAGTVAGPAEVRGDFSVLSAEKAGANAEENLARMQALYKDLDAAGVGYQKIDSNIEGVQRAGVSIPHNENIGPQDLEHLARSYGQERILHHIDQTPVVKSLAEPKVSQDHPILEAPGSYKDALAKAEQTLKESGGNLTKAKAASQRMDSQLRMKDRDKKRYADGGDVQADPGVPQAGSSAPVNLDSSENAQVNVLNLDGNLVSIPRSQLGQAQGLGYAMASPEDIEHHERQEKYGSLGQQAITGLEGAASAATFGVSTEAEQDILGVDPADIRGRREENPVSHGVGQVAGLVGSAFLAPEVSAAGILERAGASAVKAVGLGATESTLAKIGSAAVKGAAENALFQVGEEGSKLFSGDPNQSFETAATDIGLSALVGAGIGGAVGSVPPLWEATMGGKTGGLLKQIVRKAGGIEGQDPVVSDVIQNALEVTGLAKDLKPEIRASLSDNRSLRELASVLSQTDVNPTGRAYQEAAEGFRRRVAEVQAESMGSKLGDLPAKGEIDKYTTGKDIGDALAEEYGNKVAPLAKEYEQYSSMFEGKELDPSISDRALGSAKAQDDAFGAMTKAQRELTKALAANSPERAIKAQERLATAEAALKSAREAAKKPGATDAIIQDLGRLAEKEGWLSSPSSDIMREVNRIKKELPNLKTLKDLTNYIKQVGENTRSTLPFGQQTPVSRAGGMIKKILREAESNAIASHIGSEEGVDAVNRYRLTQKAYAKLSELKEAVDDRLGAGGSTGGYGKTVGAMAKQEGEKVLNRLSGRNDADWLGLVSREFPRTAERIKAFHREALLAAAKDGDSLSSAKLMSAMDKMSPQLRDFAIPAEAQGQIKAAHSLLDQFNDSTHNFSNTGRTATKLLGDMPGAAVAMVTGLASHNPILGGFLGLLTKTLGKDVPDACRLAMLKFLGSTNKVDPGAFASAVSMMHSITKGETLVSNGVKNLFKAGREVLPQAAMPSPSTLDKLDKKLKSLQTSPQDLLHAGGNTGYYMPEHGQALSQYTANAVNYVNSQRPNTQVQSPLDSKRNANPMAQAAFQKTLTIAQQPLVVLDKIKKGTLTPKDVIDFKNLAPNLHDRIVQKLMAEVVEAKTKGTPIPYQVRMGMSMLVGQPLDSTMTPMGIMNAQPVPKPQPPPQGMGKPKKGTATLNKLPGQYETAGQARQKDRQSE